MGAEPPAWATQPVEIVPADPRWPQHARELITAVEPRLARWLVGPVEHVGSTAVPGLAAKPVIDLLAPVASLDDARPARAILASAGWQLIPPELDERPWRRAYVLADGARRVAHLHLIERAHPRGEQMLAFRDRLRADPELATAYARLKRRAAAAHRDDREAYTAAKAAFVEQVVTAPGRAAPDGRRAGPGPR